MCTWNSNRSYFRQVLESIKREIAVHCFILLDRFSGDSTVQVVRQHFPDAKVILTNDELARARELGIKHVSTDFFIFVDDDIVLPKGWFQRLWKNVDSRTGAIHAHAVPAIRLPYEEKWGKWQEEWSESMGKPVKRGNVEVNDKNMDRFLGYTHNTIVRTDLCRDWRPPATLSVFEDQVLLWHVVRKGYKWKIVREISVQHYSYGNLTEHLRKVRWRIAGGRVIGVHAFSLKQLIIHSLKRSAKGLKASMDQRDPRILAYVLLLNLAQVDGYSQWNKYVHLARHRSD